MKIITERVLIREVARRWAEQYSDAYCRKDKKKQEIGRKLAALDVETATPADVAAIIGNSSWTRIDHCDDCKTEDLDVAVAFGSGEYSNTICLPCLHKAATLASGVAIPDVVQLREALDAAYTIICNRGWHGFNEEKAKVDAARGVAIPDGSQP